MRISIAVYGKYRAAFNGISIAPKEQISSALGAYISIFYQRHKKMSIH